MPEVLSALLHDVVEDTAVRLLDIEREFGREVARIVDGVTKLDKVQWLSEGQRPSAAKSCVIPCLRPMMNLGGMAGIPRASNDRGRPSSDARS